MFNAVEISDFHKIFVCLLRTVFGEQADGSIFNEKYEHNCYCYNGYSKKYKEHDLVIRYDEEP